MRRSRRRNPKIVQGGTKKKRKPIKLALSICVLAVAIKKNPERLTSRKIKEVNALLFYEIPL